MTISFTRYQGSVLINITAEETGQIEVLDPQLASKLFAESHLPKVGDIIIFDAPGQVFVPFRRVQGQDMPKTTTIPGNSPDPVTYVFAVANPLSEWTVTDVGQDDSVTITRGLT